MGGLTDIVSGGQRSDQDPVSHRIIIEKLASGKLRVQLPEDTDIPIRHSIQLLYAAITVVGNIIKEKESLKTPDSKILEKLKNARTNTSK